MKSKNIILPSGLKLKNENQIINSIRIEKKLDIKKNKIYFCENGVIIKSLVLNVLNIRITRDEKLKTEDLYFGNKNNMIILETDKIHNDEFYQRYFTKI